MDSSALLRSQGWLGAGYSLSRQPGRGLRNPIKIQQKNDVLGVGKKRHEALTGQWWAKGFDDVLKSVNATEKNITADSSKSKAGGVDLESTSIPLNRPRAPKFYASFVKGESLEGTIPPAAQDAKPTQENPEYASIDHGQRPGAAIKTDSGGRKRKRKSIAKEVKQEQANSGSSISERKLGEQVVPYRPQAPTQKRKGKKTVRKAAKACRKVI